jgi:hypothetical protein
LYFSLVLEIAQRVLDIFVDALCEQLVGGGDAIGRLDDLVPWRLEDAMNSCD